MRSAAIRSSWNVLVFSAALSCLCPGTGLRAAEQNEDPAAEPSEDSGDWDRLRTQLTELQVDRAVDGDSALSNLAVEYLKSHPAGDERWEEMVTAMLSSENAERVMEGVEFLSTSQLDPDQRFEVARSALKTLSEAMVEDLDADRFWWRRFVGHTIPNPKQARMRQAAGRIIESIQPSAERFHEFIRDAMREDQPVAIYFLIVAELAPTDTELAERLMELSRSDDVDTAALASLTLDRILDQREERAQRDIGKTQSYAERIFARMDRNRNGRIEGDELDRVVMDIRPADSDGDGSVTVDEYARWFAERTSR